MVEGNTICQDAFPTTRWSMVDCAAQNTNNTSTRDTLSQLLERYLPALKAFLTKSKLMVGDEADELLQDFVVDKVIRDRLISHASKHRGRFRNFLLRSLQNYMIDRLRHNHAKRRSPSQKLISINELDVMSMVDVSPLIAYDIAWARGIIDNTLMRMEAECLASRKMNMWHVFENYILIPILDQTDPIAYGELAKKYHYKSPTQALNVCTTAKRMFIRNMRLVIGQYAKDDQEIDEEIADLRKILAQASTKRL